MSFAVFWNFMGAGVAGQLVPQGINWGHARLLGTFSGPSALALILVWLFVPSTNEVASLEDMSCVFGVSLKDHAVYQIERLKKWMKLGERAKPFFRRQAREDGSEMVEASNLEDVGVRAAPG